MFCQVLALKSKSTDSLDHQQIQQNQLIFDWHLLPESRWRFPFLYFKYYHLSNDVFTMYILVTSLFALMCSYPLEKFFSLIPLWQIKSVSRSFKESFNNSVFIKSIDCHRSSQKRTHFIVSRTLFMSIIGGKTLLALQSFVSI